MNSQKRQKRQEHSTTNNRSNLSDLPSKLIFSGVGVGVGIIAVLFVFNSILGLFSSSRKLNLKQAELNPAAGWQKEVQNQAPRYGLDDKTVSIDEVQIILRDNGYEDGDRVTLFVNGKAYTQSIFLTNAGQAVLVPLNPGQNLVQITGDRDGGGGITLAADVSSQGNMSSSPIPVGSIAAFYVIQR